MTTKNKNEEWKKLVQLGVLEFTVKCPKCGKTIESYGDDYAFCLDCKLGFIVDVYYADYEKINHGERWYFKEKINANRIEEEVK